MNTTTRLYCINSIYLGPIQKGIQSLHAYNEMCNNIKTEKQEDVLIKWKSVDKTIIMLDSAEHLNEKTILLLSTLFNDINVPYGYFKEPCLNDTITSLCFVLPDDIRQNYVNFNTHSYVLNDYKREAEDILIYILTKLRLSV